MSLAELRLAKLIYSVLSIFKGLRDVLRSSDLLNAQVHPSTSPLHGALLGGCNFDPRH